MYFGKGSTHFVVGVGATPLSYAFGVTANNIMLALERGGNRESDDHSVAPTFLSSENRAPMWFDPRLHRAFGSGRGAWYELRGAGAFSSDYQTLCTVVASVDSPRQGGFRVVASRLVGRILGIIFGTFWVTYQVRLGLVRLESSASSKALYKHSYFVFQK